MNIRNFVFLTALCSSMVLTAAPGDILRAKIRYGKDYPMLKKAMKPEDLNVLAREDGTVTFFGDKKKSANFSSVERSGYNQRKHLRSGYADQIR